MLRDNNDEVSRENHRERNGEMTMKCLEKICRERDDDEESREK